MKRRQGERIDAPVLVKCCRQIVAVRSAGNHPPTILELVSDRTNSQCVVSTLSQ